MLKTKTGLFAAWLMMLCLSTLASAEGNTPEPDGAEIFEQLPEEIQNKIIDESTKYYRECSTSGPMSFHYDCDCVRQEFINIRTTQGPDPTGTSLYKDAMNRCVAEVPQIAKYYAVKCEDKNRTRLKDVEGYCQCFSETMAKKFIEKPYFTLGFLGILHKESRKECGYNNYR